MEGGRSQPEHSNEKPNLLFSFRTLLLQKLHGNGVGYGCHWVPDISVRTARAKA